MRHGLKRRMVAPRREPAAVAAAMVILGIGVERAHAQDGEFIGEWLWEVTTDDGDALVEPGETAAVTLSVDLDPSVGDPGPTPGLVVSAFGGAKFDVLGGQNADKGEILGWEYPTEELLFGFGDLATTDGVSIFGVSVAQGLFDAPEDTSDPLDILTFFWTTDDFSTYIVEYMTLTDAIAAWEGEFVGDTGETDHSGTVELIPVETSLTFQVVPSPGSTFLMGSLLASLFGRRRRLVGISAAAVVAGASACPAQQQPGEQVRIIEEAPLRIEFDGPSFADSGEPGRPPDPRELEADRR